MLVASLHQGIADILPSRLTFYENWLNAEGLREGTIGLAPLYAVLSFLRQEGDAYKLITTRAGEYAADWTVQSLPPFQQAMLKRAPLWLRRRLLLRLARRLVSNSYKGSRAISRLRGVTARVEVRASVFCTVREKVPYPLCGFYPRHSPADGALRHQRQHRDRHLPRRRRDDVRVERVDRQPGSVGMPHPSRHYDAVAHRRRSRADAGRSRACRTAGGQ